MHFTKEEYRPAIHEQGLKAGASKGIGLPNDMGSSGDNEPDPSHVYVLSDSLSSTTSTVSGDAG